MCSGNASISKLKRLFGKRFPSQGHLYQQLVDAIEVLQREGGGGDFLRPCLPSKGGCGRVSYLRKGGCANSECVACRRE